MNTDKAIAKYGRSVCREAWALYKEGNGAKTIGSYYNLTTAQADCAINAGRALEDRDEDLAIEQLNLQHELEHNQ